MKQWNQASWLVGVLSCLLVVLAEENKKPGVFLPGVRPQKEDTYLCTAIKLEDAKYITEFIPRSTTGHGHHIILAGCAEPGSNEKVWNCGEMHAAGEIQGDAQYSTGPHCRSGMQILYAWGMDAAPLKLPEDVSFTVGAPNHLPYLVVQVHFKNTADFVKNAQLTDNSGVEVVMQDQPTKKSAGVHLSVSGGNVPANSVTYLETACTYNGQVAIHPFAFRTHTHTHGRVVSGFRVREGDWKLIGSGNPQMPQMFYKVNSTLTIKPNDVIAARCVMENKGSKDIPIGNTQAEEMCNFYIMFWTPSDERSKVGNNMCYGEPPMKWPELEDEIEDLASTIPGTKDIMREFIQEEEDETEQLRDLLEREAIWENAKAVLANEQGMPEYLVEEREKSYHDNAV